MKKYKKGDIIIEDGSKEDEIFILIKGAIAVYKGDIKISEFNEAGTIIGELSLILDHERTATIVALEDSELVNLKLSVDQLITKFPGIVKCIMRSMGERLVNMTDNYWKLTAKTRLEDIEDYELENREEKED